MAACDGQSTSNPDRRRWGPVDHSRVPALEKEPGREVYLPQVCCTGLRGALRSRHLQDDTHEAEGHGSPSALDTRAGLHPFVSPGLLGNA
ncbi:hypothetical protein HL657_08465 [Methanoculleus sp. YWC-01]|uniref:Uncharacterized protein n=1 Tax=Methanoculleus nereidis TaxID=2735141 RepID=A0ABU3Z302_9EURY|nr:hypothetical protein [Methanoculleus sp. YWC-01]MDV4343197.1 hypothetical protein [Methanoculleus sp. YWC-01]